MKSTHLALLMAMAIGIPTAGVAQDAGIPMPPAPSAPPTGTFRHGELGGVCYRGDNLGSYKRETCRITIFSRVLLLFARTSSGISILVTNGNCGEPSQVSTTIPAAALKGPGRAKQVAEAMRATVAAVMAGCRGYRPDPIDENDMAAVLDETDGLKDPPQG